MLNQFSINHTTRFSDMGPPIGTPGTNAKKITKLNQGGSRKKNNFAAVVKPGIYDLKYEVNVLQYHVSNSTVYFL